VVGGSLVIVTSEDPLVVARIGRLEAEGVCTVIQASPSRSTDKDSDGELLGAIEVPAGVKVAVVVDLEDPRAMEELAEWKQQLPDGLVIGHVATMNKERWLAAERAGCDVVTNRGAVARQLRKRLGEKGMVEKRVAVAESRDVAGRLGLVARLDDTPVGPVAIFNLGWTLVCLSDLCPHAGARLSEGSLEEGVVTCPRHGSQFDVVTGERVRGPSDLPVAVHKVLELEGRVYMVLPAG
jgi:nitrite reductase/ring-hydroxylating ferredoxin subunit